jgi:uncharacterized membrane protein
MTAVERLVHQVLAIGLAVSVTLLLTGVVAWLVRREALPGAVTGPVKAVQDLGSGRPNGFFSLGLLALILTPFVRVAGSVIIFLHERDRRYAGITAVVLGFMILSLFVARF